MRRFRDGSNLFRAGMRFCKPKWEARFFENRGRQKHSTEDEFLKIHSGTGAPPLSLGSLQGQGRVFDFGAN
jgi:hypothetical protein